jgi:NAD+ synthase
LKKEKQFMKKYAAITDYLTRFLHNEVRKTGHNRVVVGLSGGIDSAVVAVLAQKVFGDDLVCVKMPSTYSSQSSLDDADALCKKFSLHSIQREISDMLQAYETANPERDNLRLGNVAARLRMITLFDESAKQHALVLGTSNKSELMLGYGTLYGDLASAVNPIGDLYKSEVYELAEYLQINRCIIEKAPSADLWSGQSDEADLGYTYAQIDSVLRLYVEERLGTEEIIAKGMEKNLVKMIVSRIFKNHFKRKMPVVAKLTSRTVNHDFNYPRDIGL